MRERRVGTFTLGCMLVVFGVLFILHACNQVISYELIFHCWPVILICLGVEVLCALYGKRQLVKYDKGAIVLLMVLTLFCMGMAAADWTFSHIHNTQCYLW